MKAAGLMVLGLLVLTACGETNPLLGDWRLAKGPDSVAKMLRFTDSQSIAERSSGDVADVVTYEVKPGQVIVTSSLGFKLTYKLVDENTISVSLPGMGVVSYSRANP